MQRMLADVQVLRAFVHGRDRVGRDLGDARGARAVAAAVCGGGLTRAGTLLAAVERDGCGYCHRHAY
jgi:hypothetical protein